VNHIQSFLAFIQYEKRYSPNTLLAYQNDLEQFVVFLQLFKIPVEQASHFHIRNWMVELIKEGLSPRSVNRKISSLKSFYKFLFRKGVIQHHPLSKVILPKTSKKLPAFVDEAGMEKLLEKITFSDDIWGDRDRVIIELFYVTGIRRSELRNLKNSDLDFWNSQIKVIGKGNKQRLIPLHRSMAEKIKNFISKRENELPEYTDEYIFPGKNLRPIQDHEIYRMVKKYLSVVTTLEKKSPHILRHSFATHLLNAGAEINAVKEMLGHANLAATQVYTHNTVEKLKRAHQQAHPRG
jgi:integrase/recombinase XerC